MRNLAGKTIAAAAIGLSLLMISPRAFSQSKPASEPIGKEAPKARKSNGAYLLNSGDTLFAKKVAGDGAENARLVVFSKSKGIKMKKNAFATCPGTGSLSGRVDYFQGGKQKAKPFTAKFVPRAPVPKAPVVAFSIMPSSKVGLVETILCPKKEQKAPARAPRAGFFRISPLPSASAAMGPIFSYSSGLPSMGVTMENGWALSSQMAFNIKLVMSASLAKQNIEGNFYFYKNIPAFSKEVVSARNYSASIILPFEWGTKNFSILFGPLVGVSTSSGKFKTLTIYSNGYTLESNSSSYACWKTYVGFSAEAKANIGESISIAAFYRPEFAFMVDRYEIPMDNVWRFSELGIAIVYKFRISKESHFRGR